MKKLSKIWNLYENIQLSVRDNAYSLSALTVANVQALSKESSPTNRTNMINPATTRYAKCSIICAISL